MFCEKCGSELAGVKKFCTTCGAPVLPVRRELGAVDPFASTSRRDIDDARKSNYGPPSGGSQPPVSKEPASSAASSGRAVSPLASSHFVVDAPVTHAKKPTRNRTEEIEMVDPTKVSHPAVRPNPPKPLDRFPSSLIPAVADPTGKQGPSSFPPDREAGPMSLPNIAAQSVPQKLTSPAPAPVQPMQPVAAVAPVPVASPASVHAVPAQPASVQGVPYAPGGRVWVRWANGQTYPGTVFQVHAGRCLVGFADGQHYWIEFVYLQPG